jgi:hypothetical protein
MAESSAGDLRLPTIQLETSRQRVAKRPVNRKGTSFTYHQQPLNRVTLVHPPSFDSQARTEHGSPRRNTSCREVRSDPKQAKRLRDAEIDDKFELGRLHYRQVGRFLTFEDTARIHADMAIGVGQVRSVGDESPGCSKLAPIVDRGKAMACRQCDDLIAPPEEIGIGADDERASSLVNKRVKSGSHVMLPAGVRDYESLADSLRRSLHFAQVVPGFPERLRVREIAERRARWRCLLCRKADAREIGPYHDIAGETARLDRFTVIRFGQRTVWNLPNALALRTDRRAQMCEHEILRPYPLRHCTEIGSPGRPRPSYRDVCKFAS